MPDTRGRPLPSEVLDALKNPQVTNWLRSFLIQTASAEAIGRFPGNGSAQDDQYVYPDDADAGFAYNFDYVIPSNFQRLISAKLSFKIRPFRAYNTFSAVATGAGSSHFHGFNHFHTHNHGGHIHDMFTIGNVPPASTNTTWFANPAANNPIVLLTPNVGNTSPLQSYSTTPANDSTLPNSASTTAETAHTHPISITSTLGIFEDVAPSNPGITVSVDGVSVTTAVGGPFNSDQVEIDVTRQLATTVKLWHTLALQPNQRVRITGILRLSYYVDSRVPQ